MKRPNDPWWGCMVLLLALLVMLWIMQHAREDYILLTSG